MNLYYPCAVVRNINKMVPSTSNTYVGVITQTLALGFLLYIYI